jgi:hypothetical protein
MHKSRDARLQQGRRRDATCSAAETAALHLADLHAYREILGGETPPGQPARTPAFHYAVVHVRLLVAALPRCALW